MQAPDVAGFFDEATNTISYIVSDPETRRCAVIDPVLDYDPASSRTAHTSADGLIAFVRDHDLKVSWVLETHVHADHLTAAPYVQKTLGGRLGIGADIAAVQATFARLFNAGPDFAPDGRQFDVLFDDEEPFAIGTIAARVLHTPGHTPACVSYIIGDAVFVGDTLFMPDFGTARCDFPGGDARQLYRSIRRILSLPDETRLFVCHDYKAPGRDTFAWETTVGAQRRHNVHVHDGVDEEAFARLRTQRDAGLAMPRLILPAVQVNMRAGALPPADLNGVHYLKIPIDAI